MPRPVRNVRWQVEALLRVEKEGRPAGTLTTVRRALIAQEDMPTTEVAMRSSFLEDLYVILSDVPDLRGALANDPNAQTATFTFMVNPLVGWIWYGGMIIALGGLIGLWPGGVATRARTPVRAPARAGGPVLAGAD